MEKVLNNKDLYQHILSFQPLSNIEKRNRKKVILELKHKYCEWASHLDLCYMCEHHHPLIHVRRFKKICPKCLNYCPNLRYYFFL